jgi:anthranilate phosphoribosyltransferase
VSLAGPTQVREVRGGEVRSYEWSPADFSLPPCAAAELLVDGPEGSAKVARGVLEGQEGPAEYIVLANAAAALVAAEEVNTPREGVARAREAIRSGRAREVLERLVACARE